MGEKIFPGQVLEYKIKPIGGIRVYWMTEITQVANQQFFIDEQWVGCYSIWSISIILVVEGDNLV